MTLPRSSGLEDIVAADTALSDVDGHAGRLVLAGQDVETLAPTHTFAAAAARLLAAAGLQPGELDARLGEARVEAHARLRWLDHALSLPDAMDALRATLAHLHAAPEDDELSTAVRLIGATAVFAAAWARRQAAQSPLAPDPALGHAADFLRLTHAGAPPAPDSGSDQHAALARALDTYLVTVMDHGMNASTFAARVVASTGSDSVSAVVAAVGALKGPLHGGAPGPVLDMLDQIGAPARARPWLEAELAAGRRIMGMGHRVYRVRDPRAAVLEAAVRRLAGQHAATPPRLLLASAVEETATALLGERHPDRPLRANVEFYTAVLLEAVGVPRALFSATFAVGRVVGWLAHVTEQRRTGRLIRPQSRYVGPRPA